MKGVWNGKYWFNEDTYLPEILKERKIKFKILVTDFDGKNFKGTVEDDIETGGTPGTGTIKGRLKKDTISFVKKMPVYTVVNPDGSYSYRKGKHPNIYYTGTISTAQNTITGSWYFKRRLVFAGIIPFFLNPTAGRWMVEKEY
jgi:hypothetical protein